MEKFKFETTDQVAKNIDKLASLFPAAVTEVRDENGQVKRGVNFQQLKQLLSWDEASEEEFYEFTWVGKKAAIAEAARPTTKTLRPVKEISRDWDTTRNLYIEGENLEVLKLLQESYLGQIQLIYIDPPYNTGNDFLYRDKFQRSQQAENEQLGVYDEQSNILFKNVERNGRFHSDWCSNLYARLRLAKNLLAEDGLLFISIGDEEVGNLRKMADEIFGEDNFRNQIVVRRGAKSLQAQFDTWDKLGQGHEYLLFYSKNSQYRFPKQVRQGEEVRPGTWNNHWRGTDRPTMRYELFGYTPETGQWRWSRERSLKAIENYQRMLAETGCSEQTVTQEIVDAWYAGQEEDLDLLRLSATGKAEHYVPPSSGALLNSLWADMLIGSSSEINQLFHKKVFDTAKLTSVLCRILRFAPPDATVLDFFSGSASTAHAVMQLNAEDGGHRNFIMVQAPAPCPEKSEAYQAGYKTIVQVGQERIRRAGDQLREKYPNADLDVGFRVFRTDSSNMKDVYYQPEQLEQQALLGMVSNIKEDRTDLDLLYACLLDWGMTLDLPHSSVEVEGCIIHNVDDGALMACFHPDIPDAVVEYMAAQRPRRAVFRDSCFARDDAKINIEEKFKNKSPDTRIKVL